MWYSSGCWCSGSEVCMIVDDLVRYALGVLKGEICHVTLNENASAPRSAPKSSAPSQTTCFIVGVGGRRSVGGIFYPARASEHAASLGGVSVRRR